MSVLLLMGMLLIIILIILVGAISGKKITDSKDFLTGGGKASAYIVCGAIMGSLVSSQATIGTAQLAFNFGLSAWWFTLGSGIGCLILGLIYAKPLRDTKAVTVLQIISNEYGKVSGSLGSILCSIGIFLSVLAQVVACAGLINTIIPSINIGFAAFISIVTMCFYVVFGGTWGAGIGGVVKLSLIYVTSILGMLVAIHNSHGVYDIFNELNYFFSSTNIGNIQKYLGISNLTSVAEINRRYLNLFSRGIEKDLGSGLSLLIGVLSTQTYAQAVLSGKNNIEGKKGAILSAILIPPLGIAGIIIGVYMRSHYILRSEVLELMKHGLPVPNLPVLESTINVFPQFVIDNMNPFLAGIILGTLLISSVGGGAGLSLGMATILVKDIYEPFIKKVDFKKYELSSTRITIVVILVIAAFIASMVKSTLINDYGFLSMGLRGTVIFVPLSSALWFKDKIDYRYIIVSIIISPIIVIIGNTLKIGIDPLFLGIISSLLIVILGYCHEQKTIIKNK